MCGAKSFRVLGKGAGVTESMVDDFLKACGESSKLSTDGNERCAYITKFAKEKFGGIWQALIIPYAPPVQRGGSIKWAEDKHLYIDCETGKFQIWIWKTG